MAKKKKEKELKDFTCRECGENVKLDMEEQKGIQGWKCMKCYTINPFTAPPSVTWRCSLPPTTPRSIKR